MIRRCPRTYCPDCGQELIHRDNRHGYESSSALGQIINREVPHDFGCGDVDLFTHRARFGLTLLRWLEHKQPGHKFDPSQRQSLADFDRILRHAVTAPPPGMRLHPGCGVYVVRGQLTVASIENPRRKVDFAGPQTLLRPDDTMLHEFTNRAEFYDWLRDLSESTPGAAA